MREKFAVGYFPVRRRALSGRLRQPARGHLYPPSPYGKSQRQHRLHYSLPYVLQSQCDQIPDMSQCDQIPVLVSNSCQPRDA